MTRARDGGDRPPQGAGPDSAHGRAASWTIQEWVFRTLVDMIPDRIYAKDTRSRFIFANKAVAFCMGAATPDEMIGKTDFDFYPEDIASQYFAVEQELIRSEQPLIAFEQLVPNLSNGETGWLQTTKVLLRDGDGRIIGLVGVGRDVTATKRFEQALMNRNTELTEVNERLRQAQEQLIQAEKLASLGRVVAGVAHELNTPLGNAMTISSSLEDRYQALEQLVHGDALRRADLLGALDATKKGFALIQRNVARAAGLVGTFKQLAVDQASDTRRRFELAGLVEDMLATLRPRFGRTAFELQASLEPGIVMDSFPGPLGQVITNLALNALVHGFAGKTGGLAHIACSRVDAAHARLLCVDDGAGMTPEACRQAFEPFFTTTPGPDHAGLGLYIAHGIVTGLLGGTVTLQSGPGEGTTIEILLPLTAPGAVSGEAAAPA